MRPPMIPSTPIQIPPASIHGDMVTHGSGICLVRFLAETEIWTDLLDHELPCNHECQPLAPLGLAKNSAPSALANQPSQGASGTHPFHPHQGVQPAVDLTVGDHRKIMNLENSADLAVITNGAEEAIINATLTIGTADQEGGNSNTAYSADAGPDSAATGTSTIVTTEGADGVIHIRSNRTNRKGAGRRQPKQPPVPANPATVANSLGIPWGAARTSVDNSKSRKWGLALRQVMNAQGIADFQRGDKVEVQVGVGAERVQLVGRASRPSTAYYWSDEFTAGSVGLHEVISVIIVAVYPAGSSPATTGGAL